MQSILGAVTGWVTSHWEAIVALCALAVSVSSIAVSFYTAKRSHERAVKEHEDTHEKETKRHRDALLRLDLQRMADYSIELDIYAIAQDIDRDPPRPPITLNKDLEKLAHPTLNTVLKSVSAVRIFNGRYPPGTETSDDVRKAQVELANFVADSLKATEDLRRAVQTELVKLGA